MDTIRLMEQDRFTDLEDISEEGSGEPSPEDQATDRFEQQALWNLLNSRLQDEKERAVIQGSFVLALKPQELLNHYRGLFTDIDEIYRVKQNIIARLRRDPEFRKFLG
jgi:hypothetical protein